MRTVYEQQRRALIPHQRTFKIHRLDQSYALRIYVITQTPSERATHGL